MPSSRGENTVSRSRFSHISSENRAHIREVLIQTWDPIGICGIGPDDEYDRYIRIIHSMLPDDRTNRQRIADHLLGLAVTAMGLSNTPRLREKCRVAAAALLALRPQLATGGRPR
jgi:hypothetical protein